MRLSALIPASIKTRILVFVVFFEIMAYGTIQLFNNYVYKNALLDQKAEVISQTIAASVAKINNISELMERNATSLAIAGEHFYQFKQQDKMTLADISSAAEQLLVSNFASYDQAIGGGIWYQPHVLDKQTKYFGPYAYREGKQVNFSWDLNTPEYDYLNQDWYRIAQVDSLTQHFGSRIFWTEPYYDEAATYSLMMTVDAVMFDAQGKGIGMATVDWSLAELTEFLDSVKVSENAHPFFIYQGLGKFLSYPKAPGQVLKLATQFDWGKEVLADQRQNELLLLPDVLIDDELYNVYYFRTANGFVFGALMPLSDLMQSISTITTITLMAGGGIGLTFIILMILLMRLLFSPFDKVLALIKGSISHLPDDKQTVVIAQIDYYDNNEFTPIINALDDVYQQVTDYLAQISQSRQQIEALNAELEDKVMVRTQQLEQKTEEAVDALEQLKLTQQQLVEHEKHAALGRLVAGVAHEINTPLGISVTAASVVEKSCAEIFDEMLKGQLKRSQLVDKSTSISEGCKILNDNLQRASELIASFKLVAVGQSTEECHRFNLNEHLRQVINSLESKFSGKRHRVNLTGDDSIELYSQPGALTQVLISLIDNALIHAFADFIIGTVTIETQRLENRRIEIKVSDNGKGMDTTVLDRIFDPFFTTNRQLGGNGLGMHVVFNLVTQSLNGAIFGDSKIGEGSSFVIILPLGLD